MDPLAAQDRRQLVAGPERLGVRKAALGVAPGTVEQSLQQQQGHGVEQQRRDHFVDAGDALEPGGQQRPQQSRRGTGREGQREGQPGIEVGGVQSRHGGADRPGEELTLGADVVVAGAESDRHRQSGEQQRRGGEEHLLQAVPGRERNHEIAPVGRRRAGAPGSDRDRRDEERGDDGKSHGGRRPPPRRSGAQDEAHDSACPVISRPRARGVASSRGSSPTTRPANSTTTRSAKASNSSRSSEISSTPPPASRTRRNCSWT